MDILQIKNVSRAYESHKAVDDVSFSVPKGQIFGMLGPNGAGKTSLIRMVTGITRPDSGQILFQGQPLTNNAPDKMGYMPEERGLYKKMAVGEQLIYLAQLKGMTAKDARATVDKWLEKFEISSWFKKPIEELSKGMSQKVQFIGTVLHNPELVILDEPFSGLDPVNAILIQDEIMNMKKNGTTIIFSTHRMEQVEVFCDRIVLINKGKNILEGDVAEVKQRFKENLFALNYEGTLPEGFKEKLTIVQEKGNELTLKLESSAESNRLLRDFINADVRVASFHEILPSINDIFIRQVGGNL